MIVVECVECVTFDVRLRVFQIKTPVVCGVGIIKYVPVRIAGTASTNN